MVDQLHHSQNCPVTQHISRWSQKPIPTSLTNEWQIVEQVVQCIVRWLTEVEATHQFWMLCSRRSHCPSSLSAPLASDNKATMSLVSSLLFTCSLLAISAVRVRSHYQSAKDHKSELKLKQTYCTDDSIWSNFWRITEFLLQGAICEGTGAHCKYNFFTRVTQREDWQGQDLPSSASDAMCGRISSAAAQTTTPLLCSTACCSRHRSPVWWRAISDKTNLWIRTQTHRTFCSVLPDES